MRPGQLPLLAAQIAVEVDADGLPLLLHPLDVAAEVIQPADFLVVVVVTPVAVLLRGAPAEEVDVIAGADVLVHGIHEPLDIAARLRIGRGVIVGVATREGEDALEPRLARRDRLEPGLQPLVVRGEDRPPVPFAQHDGCLRGMERRPGRQVAVGVLDRPRPAFTALGQVDEVVLGHGVVGEQAEGQPGARVEESVHLQRVALAERVAQRDARRS